MQHRTLLQGYEAALSFDAAAVERWGGGLGDDAEAATWRRWASVWSRLLGGDVQGAGAEAEALEGQAAERRDAALVIDAAALRALAAAAHGELGAARSIARRASRMARTEAIPEQEYFAHLVLSRVRRLTGHPHLATRILGALGRVAPPPWRPWITWELVLAGAIESTDVDALPSDTPSGTAARALVAAHRAAQGNDRAAFDHAARGLEEAAAVWPMLAAESRAVLDAIDVRRVPEDIDVLAWTSGASADGPPVMHGLLTRDGSAPESESAIAYVFARPGGERRRVPRLGWALAREPDVKVLPQGRRKQGRTETLVSALLLAGEDGLEEAFVFEEVYGFVYEPEVHRNIFHVLVHRAREWLGEVGGIELDSGRLWLSLAAPVLVPDPRCVKPMQDRLLRAVAQHQGATAREVAKAIGVSLRVAQNALQELSTDGACLARREGRKLCYVVEDTTFSEPTHMQ